MAFFMLSVSRIKERKIQMSKNADALRDYLKKLTLYDQSIALMHWNMYTQAPVRSKPAWVDSLSYFSTEAFKLKTAPEYGELLRALKEPEEFDALDPAMKLTVKRYLRDYEKEARVPEKFFSEFVEAQANSAIAWEKAKQTDDFELYRPHLEKMIAMTREMTSYTDPDKETYDALLDQYEEGIDSAKIDVLFEDVKNGVLPLLERIRKAPHPDASLIRKGSYDKNDQMKVQDFLLDYIGFDFECGATAESEHPFTSGLALHDVRVTNHYRPHDGQDFMFSAIHEGGHAIFEQSIDEKYAGTAVGEVNMMGLHESQSRFFENILGRNRNFWTPIYDKIQALLPDLKTVSLDDFYRIMNDVHPSLIRTSSDEVTYCLHVILRYEVEKEIFRGNMPVSELPGLWNDKMETLLGIRPANDSEGILQDMHWSDGSFGYFPSYLLGSIYDGMYLQVIERELGNIDQILAEGRIKDITRWLQTHIHQHGSMYLSSEVMKRIGAGEISAKPLIDYFNQKYSRLF